jgi:uridine kinase
MGTRRAFSVQSMLKSRQPNAGRTKIIGIDGHGGSGKSTLAELLARRLHAEILHTDDFASWDNPKNWWPELIERVLEPIAGGATTLSYPRSEWWPNHHPDPVVRQPVTEVMILEGVSSLREEFRSYLALGIFVAAPREVCLARGISRDAQMGTAEEITKLWEQYYKDEESYVQRDDPERYADVVLNGAVPFEGQLT